MERRHFLKSISAGAAFVGLSSIPFETFAANEMVKLTILHTNDVHSHIEPFPLNDPKFPGLGGVARRAALIKKIRQQEKNVLLLDVGDIFQGTAYFNMYGGELEIKLMSQMGYDASTVGNHDFDNGLEGLAKQLPNATFPLITCNYDFSDTVMNGKTIPYKIIIKDGVKIGLFGIGIELDGLVDKKMYGKTRYLDPIEESAKMAHFLKKDQKCDLVICLSHLGFKYENDKMCDATLARHSKNIDIILGGHTHTFLDIPMKYRNSDGEEVIVAQVGWAGIKLGRIDYVFSRKSKRKMVDSAALTIGKHLDNLG